MNKDNQTLVEQLVWPDAPLQEPLILELPAGWRLRRDQLAILQARQGQLLSPLPARQLDGPDPDACGPYRLHYPVAGLSRLGSSGWLSGPLADQLAVLAGLARLLLRMADLQLWPERLILDAGWIFLAGTVQDPAASLRLIYVPAVSAEGSREDHSGSGLLAPLAESVITSRPARKQFTEGERAELLRVACGHPRELLEWIEEHRDDTGPRRAGRRERKSGKRPSRTRAARMSLKAPGPFATLLAIDGAGLLLAATALQRYRAAPAFFWLILAGTDLLALLLLNLLCLVLPSSPFAIPQTRFERKQAGAAEETRAPLARLIPLDGSRLVNLMEDEVLVGSDERRCALVLPDVPDRLLSLRQEDGLWVAVCQDAAVGCRFALLQ